MKLRSIADKEFAAFGQVVTGYDFSELLKALSLMEAPAEGVTYAPSCAELQGTQAATLLQDRYFGGLPLQLGCCLGVNTRLNCLEYHRSSEVDIFGTDAILLLGRQQDITDCQYDTRLVQAFFVPAFSAVELFATTLHYAPCNGEKGKGFSAVIALPMGTNGPRPEISPSNPEDTLLYACNKWLLALPGTEEAAHGAHVGLTGKNIDVGNMI